jgi:hypothetical protein
MFTRYLGLVFLFIIINLQVSGQTSTLVSLDADGELVYTADAKGNKIPDFSGVGYMNSEANIPVIPIVKIVSALAGDNLSNIQNAINEVAAMPLNPDGFRGAILFKKGVYNVSNTVNIKASGIVLRGEGTDASGTCFIATRTAQHTLFNFAGTSGISEKTSTKKLITDSYVPFGTKQVTVTSGHSFVVGDMVLLHRIPNDAWIALLGMGDLSLIDPLATNWTASGYDINFERKVTAVNGNIISLDAPVMDIVDPLYATAELMKYTSGRTENCGIENMRISSAYASETDENHGWEAVTFLNVINGWARNLEVYYFGYSAVHILDGASWITVENCKMLDAKSTVDGGRRYSFNVDGQRCLVQNCFTRNGRHDYVDGSRTPGPNVFYNCTATLQKNDIGPHHRWSTGILFDNIVGDGRIDIQNRVTSGSGHGWAGSQILFWNCDGNRMVIQDPPGDYVNWAIGCNITTITNVGDMTTEPLGIVESKGKHITAIPSLFAAQLKERLAVLPKKNQVITFYTLPPKVLGDGDFLPVAYANSALPVSFKCSDTTIAVIIDGFIQIKRAGTCEIIATQDGDTFYNAAPDVPKILTVSKKIQSIDFLSISVRTFGDSDFSPGAVAGSGLKVSYTSSDESVATILNDMIHVTGIGTSTITASQEGNSDFEPAGSVEQLLTVIAAPKLSQMIVFDSIPLRLFGDEDFNPGATTTSGLEPAYSSSESSVATIVDNMIHITGAGVSIITASQPGNDVYNPAADVFRTLTVDNTIKVQNMKSMNNGFELFPNPSSHAVNVSYNLADEADVRLFIYDVRGQAVKTLISNEHQSPGTYSQDFELSDLSKGIYYVRFSFGENKNESKMLVIH